MYEICILISDFLLCIIIWIMTDFFFKKYNVIFWCEHWIYSLFVWSFLFILWYIFYLQKLINFSLKFVYYYYLTSMTIDNIFFTFSDLIGIFFWHYIVMTINIYKLELFLYSSAMILVWIIDNFCYEKGKKCVNKNCIKFVYSYNICVFTFVFCNKI